MRTEYVTLNKGEQLIVVGDLHGSGRDFDLRYIQDTYPVGKLKNPSTKKYDLERRMVFPGDLVDRGHHSAECFFSVLDLVSMEQYVVDTENIFVISILLTPFLSCLSCSSEPPMIEIV